MLLLALVALAHGTTDHPQHRAWEEAVGQPPPAATQQLRRAPKARVPLQWTLSTEGIPCQLPFSFQGVQYQSCHPEGWCCLDASCERWAGCSQSTEMPLQLPRDKVTSSCTLKALGGDFAWESDQEANLMFVLLQNEEDAWDDEVLKELVAVAADVEVTLVFLSYKTSPEEVRSLMTATQQQLERLATARALRSFVLALQPAWQISFESCWLPSVTHAWAKRMSLLRATVNGSSLEVPTSSIRGDWALSSSGQKDLTLPLRWAGLLCKDEAEDEDRPPPSADLENSIALVARGRCSHYAKASAARALGAQAVLIFSHDEEPVTMSCAAPDGCEPLGLPVVMTRRSVGEQLLEALNRSEVVASLDSELRGPNSVGVSGSRLWSNSPVSHAKLADELRGMDYRRRLAARREGYALRVLEATPLPSGVTRRWGAEEAQRIRSEGYTELEIELSMDCEHHLDENCPPWDHELNLYLCLKGVACHDRSTTVGRWVTAYGREVHWLSAAPAAIPLLTSKEAMEGKGLLHLHTWQHYPAVSLTFWFRRGSSEVPVMQQSLWRGGTFDLSYVKPTKSVWRPEKITKAVLSSLITGHGWGADAANCAEFCDHGHHFQVNGYTSTRLERSFPSAGNQDGCQKQVDQGVVPNQYGTWPLGRAGWCPGRHVDWWDVDVTEWLREGMNQIAYKADFNGTAYDPEPAATHDLGFPAEIHVASMLTFYSSDLEDWQKPVELVLEPSVIVP